MMHAKFISTIFLLFSIFTHSFAQDVILNNQPDVNAFDPGTTVINGNLIISAVSGTPGVPSDLNDLTPLSSLETITGRLYIDADLLTNLDGLSNLSFIGENLRITSNFGLHNLDGLSSLSTIGGNLRITSNQNLVNIGGLSNLSYLGGNLEIFFSPSLLNVDGLSSLSYIGGNVEITWNHLLQNIDGLSNLNTVGGNVQISYNDELLNLDGLSSLSSLEGNMEVSYSNFLQNIDGLSSLTSIAGDLSILYNLDLDNLNGLSNLASIAGNLDISHNAILTNVDVLSDCMIGGGLRLSGNDSMANLDGLSNLASVTGDLDISHNAILPHLNPLSNLTSIAGNLDISYNTALTNLDGLSSLASVDSLILTNNDVLVDGCGIQYLLFAEEAIGGEVIIYNNPSPCSSKNDILGDDCGLNLNAITGSVFLDMNSDCLFNGMDIQKGGVVVEAFSDERTFTTVTDAIGNYEIYIDTGTYQVRANPNHNYIGQTCQEFYPVEFLDSLSEFTDLDIPFEVDIFCPYMEVDIASWSLRECFDNNYTVRYCNTGTAEAEEAYIELALDEVLSIADASVPFTGPDANNIYTFDIGNVGISDCRNFTVNVQLPCDIGNAGQYLGHTFCMDAHIYPDSICLPDGAVWNGASIGVEGDCVEDSILFRIKNIGDGDMQAPLQYHVIEDQVIFMQDDYQLLAGEEIILSYPANGSTFRLEVEQVEGHPGESNPSVAIEACGSFGLQNLGFINQFPQDDNNPFVSIVCREVTGSYDPNDKQAFPLGYAEQHFIEKNTDIEYLIRFQNTGTDTAFTVVVKDEISSLLNLATIFPGASSHPYTFRMTNNLVEFIFNDILLVDSLTNEAASHGFIKFRISQQADLPNGTVIENTAGIYFDFNPAIITNTTFHTIGEDFITIDLLDGVKDLFQLTSAKAYPNPFSDEITFELDGIFEEITLSVYDVAGREVAKESHRSSLFRFNRKNLNSGAYFFKISSKGIDVASGKMIVE